MNRNRAKQLTARPEKSPFAIRALNFFHHTVYVAVRGAEGFARLLPLTWVFALGLLAGEISHALLRQRRNLAIRNLTLAFGTSKTGRELRALARKSFRNLGANLLCSIKTSTMSPAEILKRITLEKPPSLGAPPEGQREGWVAMISHLGNWELLSEMTALFPEYTYGAFYQKLANPLVDEYFRTSRARAGITLFDRRDSLLRSINFLKAGGVVGVLVDQSAGYAGVWMPLFGRVASCSPLAATLALRARLPILPIAVYTSGFARWRLVVSEPLPGDHEDVDELTAIINRKLEEQIRLSPEDWLWAHDRWKPLRPHFLMARDQRRFLFPDDGALVEPFRILVHSPESLEDAEACLPAAKAIQRGRPDGRVTILCPEYLHGFWQAAGLEEVIPFADNSSFWNIGRALRENGRRFDAAIVFPESASAALRVFSARIPIRAGFRSSRASTLFTQHFYAKEGRPAMLAYLRAALSVGANINPELAQFFPEGAAKV